MSIPLTDKIKPAGGFKQVDAVDAEVDTTNFSNNLSSSDSDVQKALETLDQLVASGGGGDIRDGSYIWPDEATADAYYALHPELLIEGAARKIALQIQDFNSSYLAIGVP